MVEGKLEDVFWGISTKINAAGMVVWVYSGVRPRAKWIVCFNDKQQMSGDVSSEEESPQPNTVASQPGAYH